MKLKLTPDVCYVAGLLSQSKEERTAVGIVTGKGEIEQRFISIALKEFEIKPEKIVIKEDGPNRHVYFYHSRIAKQLREIIDRENYIFKAKNDFAKSYLAGIFDAAGHVHKEGLKIKGLRPKDELMLSNLGIHSNRGRILNPSILLAFIRGRSIIIGESELA